ncbi:MAG: mechanosensitive ion channel family protein [Myxococcota bacterium]|nr:mechanosensitive ion channel family protein [Myxococcota bacterium]
MDDLVKTFEAFRAHDPQQALLLSLAAIAGGALLLDSLRAGLILLLRPSGSAEVTLARAIFLSITRPLQVSIYILGLWAAGFLILSAMPAPFQATPLPGRFIAVALLFTATWALKRTSGEVRDFVKRQRARTDGGYDDFSAIEALHMGSLAVLYLVAGLILLGIIGVPPSALAGLGVAGGLGAYALTMANQILISNIFAGLVLYFDRPFGPGDWIISENGAIEGTVVRIGLRLTVITGFDQRPIYVPNSIFNSTATINASRMNNRRIKQYVGVRYVDFPKVESIMAEIRKYLAEHPGIDSNRTTLVNLVNGSTNMGSSIEGCFGSSSINFQIYAFTKVTNWVRFQNVQDEIMLKVGRIILDEGAEIAFPTTTLDVATPPEQTRPQEASPETA